MATQILTQERLQQLLDYNADTGVFTWRRTARNAKLGAVAGTIWSGYVNISVDRKVYRAHRLAWMYVHGCWPSGVIDHINRVKTDNRMVNLRDTDQFVNTQNSATRKDSPVGLRGVTWHKGQQKWRARIQASGKKFELGYFASVNEAQAAYACAAARLHAR